MLQIKIPHMNVFYIEENKLDNPSRQYWQYWCNVFSAAAVLISASLQCKFYIKLQNNNLKTTMCLRYFYSKSKLFVINLKGKSVYKYKCQIAYLLVLLNNKINIHILFIQSYSCKFLIKHK